MARLIGRDSWRDLRDAACALARSYGLDLNPGADVAIWS